MSGSASTCAWARLFLGLFHPAGLFSTLNTNTAGQGSLQNAALLPALENAESLLEADIRSHDISSDASAHYTKLVSCTLSSLFSCKSWTFCCTVTWHQREGVEHVSHHKPPPSRNITQKFQVLTVFSVEPTWMGEGCVEWGWDLPLCTRFPTLQLCEVAC